MFYLGLTRAIITAFDSDWDLKVYKAEAVFVTDEKTWSNYPAKWRVVNVIMIVLVFRYCLLTSPQRAGHYTLMILIWFMGLTTAKNCSHQ